MICAGQVEQPRDSMFENLQRELERLSGTMQVAVPLEADPEGYADKECPSPTCLFQFKIHGDDWKAIVRDEEVFCPSCRHAAPAKSWYTTEQIEAIRSKGCSMPTMRK